MEDTDDDFGELYAVQPISSTNLQSHFSQFSSSNQQQQQQQPHRRNDATSTVDERRDNDLETRRDEGNDIGVKNDSESDDDGDDFDVFVNDEDFGPKNGGGDSKEAVENVAEGEGGGGGVVGGSLIEKNQLREVEKIGRGNGNVNGSNMHCKYLRRNGSVVVGNQRSMNSWKAEREEALYSQPRMSGFFPGWAGNGNNFWLPWNRTIVDVDIATIEQKSWTYPGADATYYFNYGFDEQSWKSYCQSLDHLRRQKLSQTRNQVNESLGFKNNDAGATKEIQSDEIIDGEIVQFKQIGQAIHVEDSHTERQPSTDARRSRLRDSDVIEITVQDPDEPSRSGNELYNTLETQCNVSEKKCDPCKFEPEAEQLDGSKDYEMGKRSIQSATVTSHFSRHVNGQGKNQNSELDIDFSEKVDTSSGGNPIAIGSVDCSMKDADIGSDTTETNPCVAGIDLSFDDHGSSSHSLSYSNTCSEASEDYCYSKRNQDLRRSSSDSMKDKFQVANIDYQCSRKNRKYKNVREKGYKYSLGVRNSAEENLKHDGQRVRRRGESNGHYSQDEHILNDVPEINYCRDRSTARRHLKSEERCRPSDDKYYGYRENESSPSCSDRRSVENRFQVDCTRYFDRRDRWRSRDEVDKYFVREWDEEQFSSDRRMRRMREVRDKKPYFRNKHAMLRFSSSRDFNFLKQRRDFDDIDFDKRNRHHQLLQYRYDDDLVHNIFVRSNSSEDRKRKHVTSDINYERRSWRPRKERTFDRGDEFFRNSLDVDHPQYTVNDEYWSMQTSTSTHDFRDAIPTYDERRHQNTLFRDDTDDPQTYQRYERHSNSISARKSIFSRHVYAHQVSYNRDDAPTYHDEDDYFERRQKVFHSNGISRTGDILFDGCSDNEFHGENMFGYSKGDPSNKWHGVQSEFVHGETTMHKQIMRDGRFGVVGIGKSNSKMSTKAYFQDNEPGCRYSVELRHTIGQKKSISNFHKAGIVPKNDADGRVRAQFKKRQEQYGAFHDNTMLKKTRNIEASWKNWPSGNHANASELEEGQLHMEESRTEIVKVKKHDLGHLAQKHTLEGRSGDSQMSQNDGHEYDENRILETMAKMEKRRERFKDPVLVKNNIDSNPRPDEGKMVEVIESKGQRPARKRKWG